MQVKLTRNPNISKWSCNNCNETDRWAYAYIKLYDGEKWCPQCVWGRRSEEFVKIKLGTKVAPSTQARTRVELGRTEAWTKAIDDLIEKTDRVCRLADIFLKMDMAMSTGMDYARAQMIWDLEEALTKVKELRRNNDA